MQKSFTHYLNSPIGWLEINTNETALLEVNFAKSSGFNSNEKPKILLQTIQQLNEYFQGKRKEFNLLIQPEGSDFQFKTWEFVSQIQFGKTSTYSEIARLTGSLKNSRAVGMANGKNPIPIIIPCHRVIGSNGKLTGYAGGIERKRWLLHHELIHTEKTETLF